VQVADVVQTDWMHTALILDKAKERSGACQYVHRAAADKALVVFNVSGTLSIIFGLGAHLDWGSGCDLGSHFMPKRSRMSLMYHD